MNMLRPNHEADAVRISTTIQRYLDEVISIVDIPKDETRDGQRKSIEKIETAGFMAPNLSPRLTERLYLIAESLNSNIESRLKAMLFFWNDYVWPTY